MVNVTVVFNGRITNIAFPDVEFEDITGRMIKEEICERTAILPSYQVLTYEGLFGGEMVLEDVTNFEEAIIVIGTNDIFTLTLQGVDPEGVMNYIPDEAAEKCQVEMTMEMPSEVTRAPPLEATITERVTLDGSCEVENVANRLFQGRDVSSVFTCVSGIVDVGNGQLQSVFPFHFRTAGGCDTTWSWSASLREHLVVGIHPAVLGRGGYEAAMNVLFEGSRAFDGPRATWNLVVSTSSRPPAA